MSNNHDRTYFAQIGGKPFDRNELQSIGMSITVGGDAEDEHETIQIVLTNNTGSRVSIDRVGFSVADMETAGDADWRVFIDPGTCAWAGVLRLSHLADDPHMHVLEDQRTGMDTQQSGPANCDLRFHRSDMQTVVWDRASRRGMLVGFLGQKQGANKVDVHPSPDLLHVARIDAWQDIGSTIDAGESLSLDTVFISRGSDPYRLLETYGARVAAYNETSMDQVPITGLMTWYGHRAAVTEDVVVDNAGVLRDILVGYPQPTRIVVLLDHGWQKEAEWGTMEADPDRFEHGIRQLADTIRSWGMELGLWHTPFCITQYVDGYAELKPLMLTDESGSPVQGKAAVWSSIDIDGRGRWRVLNFFDGALPEVQERWAGEMQLLREWGATYCKMDFFKLFAGPLTGKDMSRADLYRTTWETFRRGFGAEGHLAPCSGDTNIQLGFCDSVRIAADIGVAGSWPGAANAYRYGHSTVAALWYKNRTFWVNDADSIQVGNGCSLGEARVRTTTVALSGGHMMLGDDITLLDDQRIDMIRRVLPPVTWAAKPINLFENPFPEGYPSIWRLEARRPFGPRAALAVFNLTGKTQQYRIEPSWLGIRCKKPFIALEWWQSRWIGTFNSSFEISVPAEDVAVIHAGPLTMQPSIISVQHHISGGHIIDNVSFDSSRGMLIGTITTKPGIKTVVYGYAPEDVRIPNTRAFHCTSNALGGWQMEVMTQAPQTIFEVPFERQNA